MGKQIIVQPDGQLCVWSSNSDCIIWWDFTDEELIEEFVKRAADAERERVTALVAEVRAGKRAYYQWTMTFAEALGEHQARVVLGQLEDSEINFDVPVPADVLVAAAVVRDRYLADVDEADHEEGP